MGDGVATGSIVGDEVAGENCNRAVLVVIDPIITQLRRRSTVLGAILVRLALLFEDVVVVSTNAITAAQRGAGRKVALLVAPAPFSARIVRPSTVEIGRNIQTPITLVADVTPGVEIAAKPRISIGTTLV